MLEREFVEAEIDIKVSRCPHCKSTHFIKYGRYNNEQRYQCKLCKKTFSARTNTPWYHSKKDISIWKKYYNLLFDMESLRYSSSKLEISLPTAFYWRHKILFALKSVTDNGLLGDAVHIEKRIRKENRKGQKNVAEIPRKNIWIYFVKDNHDGIIGMPSCIDNWNKNMFMKIIYKNIDRSSYIHQIGDRFIKTIADKHNLELKVKVEGDNIAALQKVIGRFNKLICQYRGIASKYIKKYMYLVEVFEKKIKLSTKKIMESIFGEDNYIKSKKIKSSKILEI